MGRVLVFGGVVIVLAFLGLTGAIWWRRHLSKREDIKAGRATKGDLSGHQEKEILTLLDDTFQVLAELGSGDALVEDVDILTRGSKTAIADLRRRYINTKRGTKRG